MHFLMLYMVSVIVLIQRSVSIFNALEVSVHFQVWHFSVIASQLRGTGYDGNMYSM